MRSPKSIIVTTLFLVSCSGSGIENLNNEELVFQSGFEASTIGLPADAHLDLTGSDISVTSPNDWSSHLDGHPNIGDFTFQYEGGVTSERYVRLTGDPSDPQNTVLQFWLQHANVERDGDKYKGRVQANLYHNQNIKELYQRVKLYLPDDFDILKASNETIHWLTIFEFWNDPEWIWPDHGFRITINIKKLNATENSPLTFGIHGQAFDGEGYRNIWEIDNTQFEIPIEHWLDAELYFFEGNENNGRFYFAITPENGPKSVIFDVTDYTHHPNDTNPDGLSHYNPMKLYTSKGLIDHVRDHNGSLQVYWDDFELWFNKKP